MNLGKLGVWFFLDNLSSHDSAETAKKIENLGYSALWLPETVGKNPLILASWLLSQTSNLIVATGIANIYNREPGVTLAAQNTLAEQSNGRFLLGLGVSHKPLVEGLRGLNYGPPVKTMKEYISKVVKVKTKFHQVQPVQLCKDTISLSQLRKMSCKNIWTTLTMR